MDLTLATRPEFDTPLADLTDVKAMMDSINVIPGVVFCTVKDLCAPSELTWSSLINFFNEVMKHRLL